jgi:hypothetical protein
MAFIRTIPPSDAEGPVREMYEQAQGRFGYVPNLTQAFSLRPGVMAGWVALLRSIQSNLPFGATSWQRWRPPVRYEAHTAPWHTVVCLLTRCSMPRQ